MRIVAHCTHYADRQLPTFGRYAQHAAAVHGRIPVPRSAPGISRPTTSCEAPPIRTTRSSGTGHHTNNDCCGGGGGGVGVGVGVGVGTCAAGASTKAGLMGCKVCWCTNSTSSSSTGYTALAGGTGGRTITHILRPPSA
ncbi:hypothetical protein Vafri_14155 [Volvox africanus]|uniref:Uncharacterized protein n=1 Tax=Volvox africanus TaxID=51714 RepID=A0A8J4F495_9CHLO|nr:hypothetical protein Vafri_14155 [Volvox africanus]